MIPNDYKFEVLVDIVELKKQIQEILKPDWRKLTLGNGWEHLGGSYAVGQYTKIGNHVFLQGLVIRRTGNSTYATVLPEGYRPSKSIKYLFGNSNDKFASAYIEPNGNLIFYNIPNDAWLDLSAINFFTNEYEEPIAENEENVVMSTRMLKSNAKIESTSNVVAELIKTEQVEIEGTQVLTGVRQY